MNVCTISLNTEGQRVFCKDICKAVCRNSWSDMTAANDQVMGTTAVVLSLPTSIAWFVRTFEVCTNI